MVEDFVLGASDDEHQVDAVHDAAIERLASMFEEERDVVFFSRQIEVRFEREWFHWITNRALRELVNQGLVVAEARSLTTGSTINLMWHRGYRYYKRVLPDWLSS